MSARPAATATLAHYLAQAYWTDGPDPDDAPHRWMRHDLTVDLSGLEAHEVDLARAALEAWEAVANLRFREVRGGGDITFRSTGERYAYASTRYDGSGAILSAKVDISPEAAGDGDVGHWGLKVYIHEIGHALGLGHAGPYDGGAEWTDARWADDSFQQTVMSYFSQTENPLVDASYAVPMTPMMADIMAIQWLYGPPTGGVTAGDTVWGQGGTLGTYLDGIFSGNSGDLRRSCFTIFDEGGIDRLDVSDDRANQVIDLGEGRLSSIYGLKGNLGIAYGTVIEEAIAGAGSDSVRGNAGANRLERRAGNDWLSGREGRDDLRGGDGHDGLYGNGGDDVIDGGAGNDVLSGGAGDDALAGGSGDDVLFAVSGRDRLEGGKGHDTLVGGFGDDRLAGGLGNDILTGQAGADVFVFDGGRDVVTDFEEGRDTLALSRALWGGADLGTDAVLGMARVEAGGVSFDFGNGATLRLDGLASPLSLADDLVLV